jgi:uncharacterized glyoxalase superfamily protein PhnB
MTERVTPMIHVPDVQATVNWYEGIGFRVLQTYDNGAGGLSFAILAFGDSLVMFNQGGRSSLNRRREVDLYVDVGEVDSIANRIRNRVEVMEDLHDTFYGMREFIIRDLNGFWVTFAQENISADNL